MSTVSREKGAIFCTIHPKKKLVFLCKQCNILICNTCITKEHSSHPVEEVEVVAEKKFRKLDEFITKAEQSTLPKAKKTVEQVEAQISTRKKVLEDGIERAHQHETYLIELVRKNTKTTVSELKGELQTINQRLHQFKSESETYLDDLKFAINECKETKKTKNDILLIDVVDNIDKLNNNSPTCQILQTRKEFTRGSNPVVDITKAFGSVGLVRENSIGLQYKDNQTLYTQDQTTKRLKIYIQKEKQHL